MSSLARARIGAVTEVLWRRVYYACLMGKNSILMNVRICSCGNFNCLLAVHRWTFVVLNFSKNTFS